MRFDRLAEVFDHASRLRSPRELDAYLRDACRDDSEMRRQVESLLGARERAGGFLEDHVRAVPAALFSEEDDDRIDRYRILGKLGEGGCGIVYLAEQEEPVRRRVALKVIKLGMDTRAVVARFEAERQALARMDHPHVARVFDAGVTRSGRPYFVMEWVLGSRITEFVDNTGLSTRARLELFVRVCRAVQHAHQKGVIHRDLKPANILVSERDGVPEPKVIDFGIAKAVQGRLTESTLFTAADQFLGTPAYMSPEQAASGTVDVDTRSDIYSLGVLLYELVTGVTPFDTRDLLSRGLDGMVRTLRETEPERPSARLRRTLGSTARVSSRAGPAMSAVSADLDAIILKCLEKDRTRRYESADELARDVERHLADEPVLARPTGTAYRLHKAYRRHRAAFAATALVALALVAGFVVSVRQARLARRESARASRAEIATAREAAAARDERDRAMTARVRADRVAQEARRFAYVANLNVAAKAWQDGHIARLDELLEAQVPRPGDEDLRDFEWRFLRAEARGDFENYRRIGRTPAYAVHFSADGSRIFASFLDDSVHVLDASSLRTLTTFAPDTLDLDLSGDGKTLAAFSKTGDIDLFETESLRHLRRIASLSDETDQIRLSFDGARIAVSDDRRIFLLEAATGRTSAAWPIPPRQISTSAWAASPDGTLLLTTSDQAIHLWNASSGASVATLPGHPGGTYAARFSPDGRWLATGGWQEPCVRLWDAASWKLAAVFTNHLGWIGRMDFSPDSSTLATGSADHTIRLWDLRESVPKAVLRGCADEVWMVSYSRDGRFLVSADRSGGIGLWRASPPTRKPSHVAGRFVASVFTVDSTAFVTATPEGLIQTWDASTLVELRRSSVPAPVGARLRFAPDAASIAVGSSNGTVRLHGWNGTDAVRDFVSGSHRPVVGIAFSADGSRLVAVTDEGFAVWNARGGTPVLRRANAAEPFWGLNPVALSHDGAHVAFGTKDLELRVVDCEAGTERRLRPDLWGAIAIEFSGDGRWMAASGRNHRVKVWRTPGFEELGTLKSWRQAAHGFAFHPGGRRLAVGSGEGGVQWTDLATGQDVGFFPTSASPRGLGFSPDGNVLAVRFEDGIRIWRAPPTDAVAAPSVSSQDE
ncbi:MAG: protein kinase [Verrucomicrobiales bacterium]|nr:protein kinase [Verrucomicrobiales bacterium]